MSGGVLDLAGELVSLVAPLEILDSREGEIEGDHVASVAARKGPRVRLVSQ